MSTVSERLLCAIKEKDVSYGELSIATHIPKSAIQRYATGETEKIPIDRLEQLAKALGVSAAYLLGWEEAEADLHRAGLSRDTVAVEMGVPPELIDQFLQNPDHPEVTDKVIRVANLLASELGSEGSGITPREYKLVTLYRTASDKDRIVVDTVLGIEPEA